MFFDWDFLVTPVNLLLYSQKYQAGRIFFPNPSKFITSAAAPLVLTPFVRNQGVRKARWAPLLRPSPRRAPRVEPRKEHGQG